MKKRLLVFHPALAPYRLDLFNSLHELFDLRLVFTHRNVPYQSYDQDLLLSQLEASYGFLDRVFSVFGSTGGLGVAREIARFAPDTVVASEFSLLSLQIAFGRFPNNPRRVVWTSDSPEIIRAEKKSRRLMRRLILPRIDGLIVYSAATRAFYRRYKHSPPQIGVSPNAQSEEPFRQKLADAIDRANELAQRHSLAGRKVLLYVGRLAEVKRIDRLLRAFSSSVRHNSHCSLVLVGGGPMQDELQALAAELDIESQTIFAGHCEGQELYAWFGLGSVFALASDFEPWGAVVNEALMAGMPVVCSNEVGARHLIADGENGNVVDADNEQEFGAALSNWLNHASMPDPTAPARLKKSLMTAPFSAVVAGFKGVIDGHS